MRKAIWSKVWLDSNSEELAIEFRNCVEDLLQDEMVQKLDDFIQHFSTTRLQHSINVAYHSYLICKFLGLDYRSAARAGILHDLFLYDWRVERQPEGRHAFAHPKVALRNARKIAKLNPIEEDGIVKHMWPVTLALPKYLESYIITFVDKYCAYGETMEGLIYGIAEKSMILNCLISGGVYAK